MYAAKKLSRGLAVYSVDEDISGHGSAGSVPGPGAPP